eukprot:gene45234-55331_t
MKKQTDFQRDLLTVKAKLNEQRRQKDLRLHEAAMRQQQELELLKLRQRRAKEEEDERNTRRFFDFNTFQRQVVPADGAQFFGKIATAYVAWQPQGPGKLQVGNVNKLDGRFKEGVLVDGKVSYAGGGAWSGRVGAGYTREGAGTQTKDGDKEETHVIYHRNKLVCELRDLYPGRAIRIQGLGDASVVMPKPSGRDQSKTAWRFLVRLHAELCPRERVLDLALVPFSLLPQPSCLTWRDERDGRGEDADADGSGMDSRDEEAGEGEFADAAFPDLLVTRPLRSLLPAGAFRDEAHIHNRFS